MEYLEQVDDFSKQGVKQWIENGPIILAGSESVCAYEGCNCHFH